MAQLKKKDPGNGVHPATVNYANEVVSIINLFFVSGTYLNPTNGNKTLRDKKSHS